MSKQNNDKIPFIPYQNTIELNSEILNNVQANILEGHGRNYSTNIFFKIKEGCEAEFKETLKKNITLFTTQAEKQKQKEVYKAIALKDKSINHSSSFKHSINKLNTQIGDKILAESLSVINIAFTKLGLLKLVTDNNKLPKEFGTPLVMTNLALVNNPTQLDFFNADQKAQAAFLNDEIESWENAYKTDQQIDFLLQISNSNEMVLDELLEVLGLSNSNYNSNEFEDIKQKLREIIKYADVVKYEYGQDLAAKVDKITGKINNELETSYKIHFEHFGYADGISQPKLIQKQNPEDEQNNNPNSPTYKWNEYADPAMVLVPEGGKDCYGSFLVYRKLEQDIKGFNNNLNGDIIKEGELMGRFKNGQPYFESDGSKNDKDFDDSNAFTYKGDTPRREQGGKVVPSSKCPFSAHARLTNPRHDLLPTDNNAPFKGHDFAHEMRIARRAIPYQDITNPRFTKKDLNSLNHQKFADTVHNEVGPVGLHFMCYQAHIGGQFGLIQKQWANDGEVATKNVGSDPVIGQNCKMNSFVTCRGAVYLYTPSINYIKNL